MARRNRRATRPARREATPERRAAGQEAPREQQRVRARGRVLRSGPNRAIGEPSQALERAAQLERGYVVKDFRRLGITIAGMLALLVASGFVVNALIP